MAELRGPGGQSSDSLEGIRAALAERYAVEREVGRGGMAVVYKARDVKHDRDVAIKVLHSELAAVLGAERFLREIRIAARLQHPHILPLYDSGGADGLLYFVMPFVEGDSLRDLIDREQQLPVDDVLRIAREVADGLAYAHENGFVHRDIKPENILISGGHAVIADFGIARAVSEAGDTRLTGTGLAMGTPLYMSPEQASGQGNLDGRSDVYALGCTIYEMLAGQPPFTGATAQSVIARHITDPVPPIRTVRPQVPESVQAAVNRAMAKAPADRHPTATDFARALTGPSGPQPVVRRSRLPLPGPWMAVVLVAALAAGAFLMQWLAPAGEPSTGRIRLVVLPFRNLGASDDAYFTEGITEEITSRLSSIARLGVIARTSAMQYREAGKSIADIGAELDVAFVVEGSVRAAGPAATADSMRISARLIRVSDGTQAWSFDESTSLTDVFAVQTAIAEQIAEQLNVALGEPERRLVAARPTEDLDAYDYYLRGNQAYNRSWARADVEEALAMYERAAEIDPQYAAAFAQVGKTHVWIHRLGYDPTERRLQLADAAIDRALELDPGLPEAHIARGLYHYWGRWDYGPAIEELARARTLRPSEAWVHLQIGNIRRRQGEWAEAITNYERAADLDPRFHIAWFNIGEVHFVTREYEDADRFYGRAQNLAPDFLDAWLQQAAAAVHLGNVERARRIIATAEERIDPSTWRPIPGFWLLGAARVFFSLAELEARTAPGTFGLDSALYPLAKAELDMRFGRPSDARENLEAARTALTALGDAQPGLPWIPSALAIAEAALGNEQAAIDAARHAMQIMPVARDEFEGPDWIVNLARVQMMVGRTAEALDNLDLALAVPSRISAEWLRQDPVWDPLREDPRFTRLLEAHPPHGSQVR